MFKLNERIDNDTFEICELSLCKVLLMNDAQYPWIILVPMIEGMTEMHHIPQEKQAELYKNINQASEIMERLFAPKSLNVAALGNVVSQLHIHVVARFETDIAWPGPIWGQHPAQPYQNDERLNKLKEAFQQLQSRS
ncbi:putative HIT family hydrolase [Candidatus Terasakiella magnetica]|uniref:Putative HIT family hydrolase n=1 Tax=Candidatus Terasakiella magnetica TaxID=1867952 RepID=A0A1C3RBY7_9PROT|nr:HIT family protein [Candidatus Terasakiella magnetica]SCA54797.1 putative HIT family hydrolase [Candidatus Terasakiella magnetica]